MELQEDKTTSAVHPLYCNSLTEYSRFRTREVKAGNVGVGGDNPIRIQSMVVSDTLDTEACVDEAIRMIEAGAELVRVTAPNRNQTLNIANIRDRLREKGYDTPLVADVHFNPKAAEIAAEIVEKVRINPGNYADKKRFKEFEISDEAYQAELERIRERFLPLVKKCKEYGRAMRIGTNHGSLSDRIMNRYGDTPEGMVESALEFVRICEEENFHDIVLSMKASNARVMVQAYRLLVKKMKEEGMNYPLHLGVTEAGDGEEARVKSAVGIGTLLEDGLGDTIRVSLTEDAEMEPPVAAALANRYKKRPGHRPIEPAESWPWNPFSYQRRSTDQVHNIGGEEVPRVFTDLSERSAITRASLFGAGYRYSVPNAEWTVDTLASDFIYIGDHALPFEGPEGLGFIQRFPTWSNDTHNGETAFPLLYPRELNAPGKRSDRANFLFLDAASIHQETLEQLKGESRLVLILNTDNAHGLAEQRRAIAQLEEAGIHAPVIIRRDHRGLDEDHFRLYASTDLGGLLLNGLGDGIWIQAPEETGLGTATRTAFQILQASRVRTTQTEYIACPSCGRTLFDLQETTQRIREKTDHLKGVKIGVMGCIVNGPGEMADADYGYVGAGPGKITLYKGQEIVKKNIPTEEAVDALIELIDEHGDWVDPPSSAS